MYVKGQRSIETLKKQKDIPAIENGHLSKVKFSRDNMTMTTDLNFGFFNAQNYRYNLNDLCVKIALCRTNVLCLYSL